VTIDGKAGKDSSLVERWIEDQREWQKTAMAYLDSMVKNDDFLVHLGNAMRGSLLAGKPYPTASAAPAAAPAQEAPADDRLDRVLFALHEMQGQLSDLRLTLDELRNGGKDKPATMSRARKPAAKATVGKPRRKTSGARKAKVGKARG
jgi:hypothetical protein